jgi:rsbT co-antagonist protein RsbR
VVLTGIRPEVAQSLVGLQADISGVVTQRDLQSGIAFAMRAQRR